MSLPTSIGAYKEEFAVFDRAIDSQNGIRVPVSDANAANHFRMRLHQARQLDRKKNSQIYQPDDPLFRSSIYDPLVVTITEENGIAYVYLRRSSYVIGQIEDLSGEDFLEGEAIEEPKAVEHQPIEDLEDDFAASGIKRRF